MTAITPDYQDVDVAIVGAGMVGASLVKLLAPLISGGSADKSEGLKLALIDRRDINIDTALADRPPSFDGRATALSWGSRLLLEHMGCWDKIANLACAIDHIQVSDRGRFGQTHLHAHEQGTEALGYIIENPSLGRALLGGLSELERNKGLQRFPNASVHTVAMTPAGATLVFEQPSSGERDSVDGEPNQAFHTKPQASHTKPQTSRTTRLRAKLLVLADGANSPLARQLGIGFQRQDYGTTALVTQIEVDRSHRHWAYERFDAAGPIAFLPLRRREFAVVWTLPTASVEEYLNIPDAVLIERLQQSIGQRVGRIDRIGERQTYPLALTTSQEQVRSGLVLLGNAAHSLHPVAGQGFNLALRDAAALAEHIGQCWSGDQASRESLGDLSMLSAYQTKQSQDQRNTILASDWLPKLFSIQSPAVAVARNMGLLALSAMPVARRLLTRHAMGIGHRAAELRGADMPSGRQTTAIQHSPSQKQG